jgi:hypothetical protein
MADVDDLRRLVLALPSTTEGRTSECLPFQVGDKNLIGVQKDGSVTLALDAAAVAAANPDAISEIRRQDKVIGIQVDLARVAEEHLAQLVKLSWRHKRPSLIDFERGVVPVLPLEDPPRLVAR